MGEHAKYSPSQLKRIIACPGSVEMCKPIANTTSSYAEEGTMLHEVMEKYLKDGIPYPETLTKEQLRACEACEEYYDDVVRELALLGIVEVSFEKKVSLNRLGIMDCWGTADVVLHVNNILHIIDWKFGQGVEVSPVDNPQLKAYGLGAALDTSKAVTEIVTHIVQPRLNNMSSVQYSTHELTDWAWDVLVPAFTMAEDNRIPVLDRCTPGEEQCQWCEAKGKCKKRFDMAREAAESVFSVYTVPPFYASDSQLAELLGKAKMLEKYIKDIKTRALNVALSGQEFPGHKVVLGRSSRQWRDEKKAQEYMLGLVDSGIGIEFDELFISKFVSVAQAEKLAKSLKKDKTFLSMYHKVDGKPALVSASDPREPYVMNAENVFGDYTTE